MLPLGEVISKRPGWLSQVEHSSCKQTFTGSSPWLAAYFSHPVIVGAQRGTVTEYILRDNVYIVFYWCKYVKESNFVGKYMCMSLYGINHHCGDDVKAVQLAQPVKRSLCKHTECS